MQKEETQVRKMFCTRRLPILLTTSKDSAWFCIPHHHDKSCQCNPKIILSIKQNATEQNTNLVL